MAPSSSLPHWQRSLLDTATAWAAVLGLVIAVPLAVREFIQPTATVTALTASYGGFAVIVALRFVTLGTYRLRALALCAALVATASGGFMFRGPAPAAALLMALCVIMAGLTLGRAALFGCLGLTSVLVFALDAPDVTAGNRLLHALGYGSATAVLAGVVLFVVARLESTVAETARALQQVTVEQALRERTQRELTEAREALYQTQKLDAVGRLAGGVAHDFNNTLQVVMGWCELIGAGTDPELVREGIGEIRMASEGSSRLTRQLLAFSRPGLSAPDRLELDEIVPLATGSYRRLLPDDLTIRVDLEPGLGVVLDRGQFTQVLLNLVLNGRDAMPGGGELSLTARARRHEDLPASVATVLDGDAVEIVVSDTGIGMDDATKARVFEPFFTTKGERGTGLGLPTVYGVVNQASGAVTIDSMPGAGTAVHIFLPRAQEVHARVPQTAATDRDAVRTSGQRVLLAEDDRGVRSSLAEALRRSGRTVVEAIDVPSARRAVAAGPHPIDVLVTDGIMPGGSTRDLIDDFLYAYPAGRVVVCSGYVDDELAGRDLTGVPFELLLKPFAPSQLVSSLDGLRHRA